MKSSITSRVRFSQLDPNEKLPLGAIVDYLQDCSNDQSESLGVGVDYQRKTGRAWILMSWQINITENIYNNEEIIVTTWPYMFNNACGHRNFTIAKASDPERNIIEADSVWIIFNTNKNCLSRISQEDIQKYECEEKLPMPFIKKKIIRAAEYEQKPSFPVRYFQLDINHHMNNAWYVKMAEEYIPKDQFIKSIRIEYKKSAKYGDIVVPFVKYEEERYLVELRNTENELYAIVEFGVKLNISNN